MQRSKLQGEKTKFLDCGYKAARLSKLKKRLSELFIILDRWDKDCQKINSVKGRNGKPGQ